MKVSSYTVLSLNDLSQESAVKSKNVDSSKSPLKLGTCVDSLSKLGNLWPKHMSRAFVDLDS